jgi:LacI family transcriptional regulator
LIISYNQTIYYTYSVELMKNKPTMKEVAKAAGVSWPTVSYVFNNSRRVSDKTREHVLNTALELGYTPDIMARGLATSRSYTIGILFNEFNFSTSIPIIAAIEEAARSYNYRLVLALQGREPKEAMLDLQDLTARRMDGIIFVSSTDNLDPAIVEALGAARIPILLAYTSPPNLAMVDSVLPDHVQGGLIATRHLLSQGRRRLAFIGSDENNNATRKRVAGFLRAHEEMQVEYDPAMIVYGEYTAPSGREAARNLIASHRPDAIFAADDNIAVGALQACQAAGMKVPEDIAIVGFDNSALCDIILPTITSVAMPFDKIGRLCLERMIYRLQQPDDWKPEQTILPCSVVSRETS